MGNDPLIGKIVGGCEILETIGQGGMGVIYRARQRSLDRIVALKVLARHLATDINFVTRFQKEARAIARVNHPNILAVYDVGDDNAVNYMIIELIDGQSLAELQAERRGALPWEEALDHIGQAAQGLEAAQAAGIVHRDIKPENLLVTKKGVVKVSDFGLAKEADANSANTSVDAVMGTPAFMSPEQCDGKKVDVRSDIYSLGGSFYRLVTGRLPFEAETAMSMMYRHKHEALIPPHEIVSTIPHSISAVIVKMMAKKREHRYQTMTDVIDALETARRDALTPAQPAPKQPATGAESQPPPAQNILQVPVPGYAPSPLNFAPPVPGYGAQPSAQGMPAGSFGVQPGAPAAMGAPGQGYGAPPGFGAPAPAYGGNSAGPALPPLPGFPPVGDPQGGFTQNDASDDPPPLGPGVRRPSGRRIAEPGGSSVFAAIGESAPALNMPSGVLGLSASGMAVPNEGYTNVSRGDEMIGRGDRLGGLKHYRLALQSSGLDQATRARVESELRREVTLRRTASESLLKRGLLVEASRECRVLVELDPADEFAKTMMKDLEGKLSQKRTLLNDLRTAIAAGQFEKAIKVWESMQPEMRDDSINKQVEQLRNIVVPAMKLAEQGNKLCEQGRLEEAISSFEDALKINPACEPARMGMKDAEQKVQRIEYMLKEGFQFSLDQNYAKAVATWRPILELRPGHPQAVKSIVDGYLALAQNLRASGDLEGALAAYEGAAEIDPQNRVVQRNLDELVNLRDKEQALVERAQQAASKNNYSEALGYWRDAQRVNPTSPKAAQQIAYLSRERSTGWVKTLILVTTIVVVVGGAYEFYYEQTELNDIRTLMNKADYAEAQRRLRSAHILFQKSDQEQLAAEAKIEVTIANARQLEACGDLQEAAKEYDLLSKRFPTEKKRQFEMAGKALLCRAMVHFNRGRESARERHWDEASSEFQEVMVLTSTPQSIRIAKLEELAMSAERSGKLVDQILRAEKQSNRTQKRLEFIEAERLAVSSDLPGCLDYVRSQMGSEGTFDTRRYDTRKQEGFAAMKKEPPDLQAARAAFTEVLNAGGDRSVEPYLRYIEDSDFCGKDGMSLSPASDPVRTGVWDRDARRVAFCIDRYEYPNLAGQTPRTGVTWVEARNFCRERDRELCTRNQWVAGCKGQDKTNMYPYGPTPDDSICNTAGTSVLASGSKPACRNSIGVYDMSGNAAEWTGGDSGDSEAWVMGGSFKTPASQAGCADGMPISRVASKAEIGFRCCRDLASKR